MIVPLFLFTLALIVLGRRRSVFYQDRIKPINVTIKHFFKFQPEKVRLSAQVRGLHAFGFAILLFGCYNIKSVQLIEAVLGNIDEPCVFEMKFFSGSQIKKIFYKRLLSSVSWQIILLSWLFGAVILLGFFCALFVFGIAENGASRFGDPLFWGLAHLIDGGFSGDTLAGLEGDFPLFLKLIPYLFALFGILLTSLFTGVFADFLEKYRESAEKGRIPYSFDRGHIIIAGWDFQCRELLRQLRREKPAAEIVILTQHEAGDIRNELNAFMDLASVAKIMEKVYVIRSDYTEEASYGFLHIAGADMLFIIGDEELAGRDTLNLSVLKIIYQALASAQTVHKLCYLHIADILLFEKLKKEDLLPDGQTCADLRIVNFYDSWGWKCWCKLEAGSEYPALHFKTGADTGTHLVIAGFGSMGRALALHGARLMNYGSGKKCKLTVIDPDECCRRDFENLFGQCDFPELETEFLLETVQAPAVQRMLAKEAAKADCSLTLVLALGGVDRSLQSYYSLSTDIKKERISILLRLAIEINAGNLPEVGMLKGNLHYADVALFGMCNRIPWYDHPADARKNAAQDVNDAYCGITGDLQARNNAWDALSENLKQANFSAGDAFKERIHAAGFRLVPRSRVTGTLLLEATPELCAAEHDRWMTDRLLLGWRYCAELRSDELLRHPDLAGFEKLLPGEQKKDALFTALNAAVARSALALCRAEALPHYSLSCIGSRSALQLKNDGEKWSYPVWSKPAALEAVCRELLSLKNDHPELVMYNSLAVGADEFFWLAARKCAIPVIGVLPLPPEEYAKDFSEGREREDFFWRLRGCETYFAVPELPRPACYAAAADYMLENSCELWAIPGGSSGGTGGTLDTLRRAEKSGKLRSGIFIWNHSLTKSRFNQDGELSQ